MPCFLPRALQWAESTEVNDLKSHKFLCELPTTLPALLWQMPFQRNRQEKREGNRWGNAFVLSAIVAD